jgi:hypothetical protein
MWVQVRLSNLDQVEQTATMSDQGFCQPNPDAFLAQALK